MENNLGGGIKIFLNRFFRLLKNVEIKFFSKGKGNFFLKEEEIIFAKGKDNFF